MNGSESSEQSLLEPRQDSACATYTDQMTDFCQAVLHGDIQPDGTQVLAHLQTCPRCATTYGDVVSIVTGAHVVALQFGVMDEALASGVPAGMLNVWRMQLGLRNQFDDLPGVGMALSVLGMVHRHAGRFEDSRDAHELALETWSKRSFSRVISRIDLGYLALQDGDVLGAIRQMALAAPLAWQLGDRAAATGAATLLSRAVATGSDALARTFLAGALAPAAAADSAGERVLVVNHGREIRVTLWSGPEIDADGHLHIAVGIENAILRQLPDQFVIDLLYVPTATVVAARRVDARERDELRLAGGLALSGRVPGVGQDRPANDAMRALGDRRRRVPRRTCELRIWWHV